MEDIDYGKTKITYLTKSKDIKNNITLHAQYQSQIIEIQSTFLPNIDK